MAWALIGLLKDIDCQILCLDQRERSGTFKENAAKIDDRIADVSLKETWEEFLPQVDLIFHFAAQTSVYTAGEDPVKDFERNVLPMVYLLETCRQHKLKPSILFSGTVTEAGMPQYLPVDEVHPDNPITIYDLHKLMAENYLKYYCRQQIVKGATLRLANVYGPGPESSSADRGVLNLMVKKALGGEDLSIYGAGEYLRDYVYVQDVIRAFLSAAINIDKVNGNHYIIGTGKGTTLAEAFNLAIERTCLASGKKVKIKSLDPPAGRSLIETRNFVANSSQFISATGWKPDYSLSEGIDQIINSLLKGNKERAQYEKSKK